MANDAGLDITAFKKRFPQYESWSDKQIEALARASKAPQSQTVTEPTEDDFVPYEAGDAEYRKIANADSPGQRFENVPGPRPPMDPSAMALPQIPTPQSEFLKPKGEVEDNINALITSMAHGGSELTHGITGPIMELLPESWGLPQGSRDVAKQREQEQEWLRQNYPKTEMLGNILGKGIVTAPIAAAVAPAAGAGAGFIDRAGSNALTGLLSGLAEYGPLQHRLSQGVINAGGGLLIPEVLRAPGQTLSASTGKLYNYAKEKLPKKAKEVIDAGKKFGVPVFAQDVSHDASKIAKAGRLSEKTVFNTVGNRIEQQTAAENAANKAVEKYRQEMINDNVDIKTLTKIAASNSKRAKAAKKLLEEIENAGDDWNSIIKSSGNIKLLENKATADKLYKNVSRIAKDKGKIDSKNIVSKIDTILKKLNKTPKTNKNAIGALNETRADMVGKTKATPASSILNAEGKPVTAAKPSKDVAKKFTFDELREIRSTLGDTISDYYTGKNTLIGKKGVRQLTAIKKEIEKELESFATKNGPELKKAWNEADKYYTENLTQFKDKLLVKALNAEKSPDEIFKMFVKAGGAEGDFGTGRALKLYNALNSKGQAAIRYGMIKNALEGATTEKGGFSPAKFATTLEKLKAARGVYFKGEAKYDIDGLTKLMRHVQRSAQVAPPETGVQTLAYIMAGALGKLSLGAPAAAAGVLTASAFLNKMLTTARGRNFLIASSRLAEDSPKWVKVLNGIGTFMKDSGYKLGQAASKNTKATVREAAETIGGARKYNESDED